MSRSCFPLVLLALAAPIAPTGGTAAQRPQVTIYQQRVVIRVPRMTPARVAATEWKEKKGPKCLAPRELAGAMIAGPAMVDLVMTDGRRMRAKLEKACSAANFYSGLYLKPGLDGQVCADREAFRVRSGGRCRIDEFRRLSPRR